MMASAKAAVAGAAESAKQAVENVSPATREMKEGHC